MDLFEKSDFSTACAMIWHRLAFSLQRKIKTLKR
jgi:hypothetical protein